MHKSSLSNAPYPAVQWTGRSVVNMSVQLLGKRELKRLASVANDGAGAG